MRRKGIVSVLVILVLIGAAWGGNLLLTGLIARSNMPCKGQRFFTVQEAMLAMEAEASREQDSSSNCNPPYTVAYTFDYDRNTIVLFRYHDYFGEESTDYAVCVLKHRKDGTLSYDGCYSKFLLREPTGNENYYYFTDIQTSKGKRSISILYLGKDSDREIYVDGKKTVKVPVTLDGHECYLCYGISNRDTFFSNVLTPIANRHKVEIK